MSNAPSSILVKRHASHAIVTARNSNFSLGSVGELTVSLTQQRPLYNRPARPKSIWNSSLVHPFTKFFVPIAGPPLPPIPPISV